MYMVCVVVCLVFLLCVYVWSPLCVWFRSYLYGFLFVVCIRLCTFITCCHIVYGVLHGCVIFKRCLLFLTNVLRRCLNGVSPMCVCVCSPLCVWLFSVVCMVFSVVCMACVMFVNCVFCLSFFVLLLLSLCVWLFSVVRMLFSVVCMGFVMCAWCLLCLCCFCHSVIYHMFDLVCVVVCLVVLRCLYVVWCLYVLCHCAYGVSPMCVCCCFVMFVIV